MGYDAASLFRSLKYEEIFVRWIGKTFAYSSYLPYKLEYKANIKFSSEKIIFFGQKWIYNIVLKVERKKNK
jgi:hypothetical protein